MERGGLSEQQQFGRDADDKESVVIRKEQWIRAALGWGAKLANAATSMLVTAVTAKEMQVKVGGF